MEGEDFNLEQLEGEGRRRDKARGDISGKLGNATFLSLTSILQTDRSKLVDFHFIKMSISNSDILQSYLKFCDIIEEIKNFKI